MVLKVVCFGTLLILLMTNAIMGRLKSDKKVLNICMDGKHHMQQPVSRQLYGLCKPWESSSCCTNATAFHAQQSFSLLYNFNLSHCGPMSEKCLKRFYLSNCFYECSPNVGPWLAPDKSSIRNERFYHIPICASDCEAWWSDCKDDLTCTDNFSKGFSWKNGTNKCPAGSKCKEFQHWFTNATHFCENIFPHDYKVTQDNGKCIKLNFTGVNPNTKVAKWYAMQKGLYYPEYENDTVTTQSDGKGQSSDSIACRSNAIVPMAIVIALLGAITTGLLYCKCRDMAESSKRAGAGYFQGIGKFQRNGTTRHFTSRDDNSDDRQFLREADDEDDSALNPHGALEIDL